MKAAPGFDHAGSFGRSAAEYARFRPRYPEALFDWVASEAPDRELAIDVAAGAGQGALALAARFMRVIAVDQSAELLATIPEHPRVERVVQDAEALSPPGPADAITVCQALHWFATPTFFARVRESLRPGGVFVAVGYVWPEVDAATNAVIQERLLPALLPHWSERNHVLMRGYGELAVPLSPVLSPPFAIEARWPLPALLAYLGTWSAAMRILEVEGRDIVGELTPAFVEAWGDPAVERVVTMPLTVRAWRR